MTQSSPPTLATSPCAGRAGPAPARRAPTAAARDPFVAVLGCGRGPQDIAQLRQALAASEGAARALESELHARRLCDARSTRRLDELELTVEQLGTEAQTARTDAHRMRLARDRVRYRLVLAGATDRACGDEFWQGSWSPRRPYLNGQVVACAGALWRCESGAQPGQRPGGGENFSRLDGAVAMSGRPTLVGRVAAAGPTNTLHERLWQSSCWWDKAAVEHSVSEMSPAYLHGVVVWLMGRASRLRYWDIAAADCLHDGDLCPANPLAYPSSRAWLLDTPLLQALTSTRAAMLGRSPTRKRA
ncbi:MAG: hypothetical protein QOC78_1780 [Solirubrobacteraceae bacterium]|nr:hypothetical protein [Solirubrobacteraceae bacterium]